MLRLVQNFQNSQTTWKVCEECGWVYEGVCECVWKYDDWISQFEYMHLDTEMLTFVQDGQDSSKCVKVCEECVWVCEGVCRSVWMCEYWIYYMECMLSYNQYVEDGPKLAKIAWSVWELCEKCVKSVGECVKEYVKVCESMIIEFSSSTTWV